MLDKLITDLEEITVELKIAKHTEQNLQSAENTLKEKDSEIAELENQVQVANTNIASYSGKLIEAQAEIADLQISVESLKAKIKSLESQKALEELRANVATDEVSSLKEENLKLKKKLYIYEKLYGFGTHN
jgi:chromosome segregation ATPase